MKVSIAICTINPESALNTLSSLDKYTSDDERIVVLDGVHLDGNSLLKKYCDSNKNTRLLINKNNEGLSYSRNLAIRSATHDYLIFFDDDIVLSNNVIDNYKKLFSKNYTLIGGPLQLPKSYRGLPIWLPEGFSSLLGIHTTQKKIWGGNFGFNLKLLKQYKLYFQDNLGRKGKQLQSGDDTTFISSYINLINQRCAFADSLAVEHHISKNRFTFFYIAYRAYWQGRSEARRKMITKGFKKEFKRAFTFSTKQLAQIQLKTFVGIALLFAFSIGVMLELLLRVQVPMSSCKQLR
jgi:glycosyltransferase involved in cell wall biosynthesis